MSRDRNPENRHLPLRWCFTSNAYYYRVPRGQESKWDGKQFFHLGRKLSDAYRSWASRVDRVETPTTIGALLDEYSLAVIPDKALSCQKTQHCYVRRLRKVFGEMRLDAIKPKDVYAFAKACAPLGKTAGRGEIEVLSHAFSKAVEWGYIDRHPFLGQVRLPGNPPRDRYIEDWEVQEMFSLQSKRKRDGVKVIQAYLRIKMMTGMTRGDLLRLTTSNFTEKGILIQRHKTAKKTGKRTLYRWTPQLKAAIDAAIQVRPCLSPFVFCNRWGKCYVNEETGLADGFGSIWARFVDRVLKETKVTERFTEHDFRAKAASDADTLEHARALLSHADASTTSRVYRRRPEEVDPLASSF